MKTLLILLGMVIGTAVGGYLTVLTGGKLFSISSIGFSAIGGIAGISVAYMISERLLAKE